jgi:hypothetical protein
LDRIVRPLERSRRVGALAKHESILHDRVEREALIHRFDVLARRVEVEHHVGAVVAASSRRAPIENDDVCGALGTVETPAALGLEVACGQPVCRGSLRPLQPHQKIKRKKKHNQKSARQ